MLPFRLAELAELLSMLGIPVNSSTAIGMAETLELCDGSSPPPPPPSSHIGGSSGNTMMRCVTSIESMVDFVARALGRKQIKVITPDLLAPIDDAQGEKLRATIGEIVNVTRKLEHVVTCHELRFPYLVYGCHLTRSASVLRVSFKGVVGHGHGLAVCHHDTSTWSSSHPAFDQLPNDGSAICHWIPRNHFVWIRHPVYLF
jgi:hypothetical protein